MNKPQYTTPQVTIDLAEYEELKRIADLPRANVIRDADLQPVEVIYTKGLEYIQARFLYEVFNTNKFGIKAWDDPTITHILQELGAAIHSIDMVQRIVNIKQL